jgi:hypothetical protein
MNDQSQRIEKGVIREFVIPVKKHLAKFMLADDLKFENPENPKQLIVYHWIETSQKWHHSGSIPPFEIDDLVQYLFNECLLKRNWFVSAEYYRKRNFSVEHRLFPYLQKNYTFLKIKVRVSTNTQFKAQNTYLRRLTFTRAVFDFNRMINNHFIDICSKYICCQPNMTKAIEEIFLRLNIKETEIRKESILRNLIRNKKIKSESVYFENYTNQMIISYLNTL